MYELPTIGLRSGVRMRFAGHPALARLDGRDRAFARLLVITALRRLGQIDALLDGLVRARPKAIRVRNLLRLGAAQLLFLETPAHAAVAETVALKADGGIALAESFLPPALATRSDLVGEADESETPIEGIEVGEHEIKAGKLEFRVDKAGIVHVPVGKVSFTEEQVLDNTKAVLGSILRAKPASAKGNYVRGVTLATTMGPGIKVDLAEVRTVAA